MIQHSLTRMQLLTHQRVPLQACHHVLRQVPISPTARKPLTPLPVFQQAVLLQLPPQTAVPVLLQSSRGVDSLNPLRKLGLPAAFEKVAKAEIPYQPTGLEVQHPLGMQWWIGRIQLVSSNKKISRSCSNSSSSISSSSSGSNALIRSRNNSYYRSNHSNGRGSRSSRSSSSRRAKPAGSRSGCGGSSPQPPLLVRVVHLHCHHRGCRRPHPPRENRQGIVRTWLMIPAAHVKTITDRSS